MAAVAVENLQRVNARGDLHLQIRGDSGGEFLRERENRFSDLRGKVAARGCISARCAPSIMNVASVHGEPVKPSSAVWSPSSLRKIFSALST